MAKVIYYILVLPFIYLISILPFPILYLFSDFVYLILYKLLGYRKKVVLQNLYNSFPNKSDKEIKEICDKFYKHLCDLFIETFKTLTISKEAMLKHCSFDEESLEIFNKLAADNRNSIMVLGHYGNWEWAGNTFSMLCKQQLFVIYHPLTNKQFDGLMYKMRTRFGTKLIPMKNTIKDMLRHKNELNSTAFIADQTPSHQNAHWTTFLNQDTPVFLGTESISKKMNLPVVYVTVRRIKRGYYKIYAETLHNNPKDTVDGEITELHTKKLEKDILAQPEIWLWSHRRWKHKRNTEHN